MPQVRDGHALRLAVRAGRHRGLTTGHAAGCVQCNLAVLPESDAADFIAFCNANARACPVVGVGRAGDPALPALGDDIDVRTDLPGYLVHRAGQPAQEVPDIASLWRDDFVAVAIGCWFSMEDALTAAGVRLRHVELGIQGPLFRTDRPAIPAGRFSGPLVVSMRPFAPHDVATVREVTARFPRVHGAPLHEGDAAALGIHDVNRPDFGEPMALLEGEVPLYWGCGLTALAALQAARLPLFITHAPGKMLVTDLRNASLFESVD
jgi:uncharacterized protein YcsI (UPF0317 family)